jgi:hypothetical protein
MKILFINFQHSLSFSCINLHNCRPFSTFFLKKRSAEKKNITPLFFFYFPRFLKLFNLPFFFFFKFFFKLILNLNIFKSSSFKIFFFPDKNNKFYLTEFERNSYSLFSNFSNFLAKFLFWQYRNRIFFLNRQFLVNLKYYFVEKKSMSNICDLNFISKLQQMLLFKKFSASFLNYSVISNNFLIPQDLLLSNFNEYFDDIEFNLHFKFFDFFKNPYSLKIPILNKIPQLSNFFYNSFSDFSFFSANLKSFLIQYKHLQWPVISENYKENNIIKSKYYMRFISKLSFFFKNKNEYSNTLALSWLMVHYLNFNVCIMSIVRGNLFFAITTARGYILVRRSQSQFCPVSKPKLYKEQTFAQLVCEEFGQTCLLLNFLGLVYFLKNAFEDARILTIFKLMAIKFQFKLRLRGIIIGRSLPHSLPGRMRKKRRQ